MGFSLKMFFEELQDVLNDPFLPESQKVEMLINIINDNQKYARECGILYE